MAEHFTTPFTLTHSEALPPVGGDDGLVHASPLSAPQQRAVGLVGVGKVGERLAHPAGSTDGQQTVRDSDIDWSRVKQQQHNRIVLSVHVFTHWSGPADTTKWHQREGNSLRFTVYFTAVFIVSSS